jgi:hypothetical protein
MRTLRPRLRTRRGGATVLAVGIISTGMAGVAQADINAWRCNGYYSEWFCYDLASDRYQGWESVQAGTQYNRDHVCAGSRTAAGNFKQGSSCSAGSTKFWSSNIWYPDASLGRGYGAWVGNGGPIWIDGRSFNQE